ncbi:MAG: hypothetical protein MUC50_23695 [Myxococcota bacterium]|nr:hypothetical protein [Myxococcota bacterium]
MRRSLVGRPSIEFICETQDLKWPMFDNVHTAMVVAAMTGQIDTKRTGLPGTASSPNGESHETA